MPVSIPKPDYAKTRRRAKATKAKALNYAIDGAWARDQAKCRACGFPVYDRRLGISSDGHVHHIVPRSRSKSLRAELSNLVLLCVACHADVHAKRLTVRGDANGTLTFTRRDK